jgi:hypothetical protein
MLAPPPSARAGSYAPSSLLVDVPTAGLTDRGTLEIGGRVFPGGGIDLRLDLGLGARLALGAGFGGLQVIGDGRPEWYPAPGLALKIRLLEENWTLPAFAVGIDTRGAGFWDEGRDRFQFKSRGVYVVASKNYAFLGDLSLHGGANRSLEDADDGDVTGFVGLEKSAGSHIALAAEYDLATNDDRDDGVYGEGRGYLNAAIRVRPDPRLEVRLVIRDMLDNSGLADPSLSDVVVDEGWGREVGLSYFSTFF